MSSRCSRIAFCAQALHGAVFSTETMPLLMQMRSRVPPGLPAPGQIARRVLRASVRDNVGGYAAQLAFYFFFALFAFLLFVTVLLAYLPIDHPAQLVTGLAGSMIPRELVSLLEKEVTVIISRQHDTLLALSVVVALTSASSGMIALAESMNRAYGVTEGRSVWRLRVLAALVAMGVTLLLALAMILLVYGHEIGEWLASFVGLGHIAGRALTLSRWPLLVLLLVLSTAVIYSVVPDVEQRWRWLTAGAVFTVAAWILAWLPFSYYVRHLSTYSVTYGGISAVVALLLWFYLTGLILLLGAEINAALEQAAARGKDHGSRHYPEVDRK